MRPVVTLSTLLLLTAACGAEPDSTPDAGAVADTGIDDANSDATLLDGAKGAAQVPYPIVGTNQQACYDSAGAKVECAGTGQDGERQGRAPSYTNNGDGTVTDEVTGMMWQQTPDRNGDGKVDVGDKLTQDKAVAYCASLALAGHDDWQLPDIKALYSLIDFSGQDVSGLKGTDTTGLEPFIDDAVFGFGYGDTSAGERLIDAQWASTSLYVANKKMMFGVNLADGRIKGYGDPKGNKANTKLFYVQCVRNVGQYGVNDFVVNGDSTVTDRATGLMWQQSDNGAGVGWAAALEACATATTGGHDDWRLPDAKELQSLVDYGRSPTTTDSPAIDPVFESTSLTNEAGQKDYAYVWSSTTHKNTTGKHAAAVYLSFGRAMGYMKGAWLDVHGAGAQRSDPKDLSTVSAGKGGYKQVKAEGGDALIHGPQGDVVRGVNGVRCVRDAE